MLKNNDQTFGLMSCLTDLEELYFAKIFYADHFEDKRSHLDSNVFLRIGKMVKIQHLFSYIVLLSGYY